MKQSIRYLFTGLGLIILFLSGIIVGNNYQIADLLCPATAKPFALKTKLKTKDGIIFPQGMIIPVRKCAYMQRFTWYFAIDNTVELNASKVTDKADYGFSLLEEHE